MHPAYIDELSYSMAEVYAAVTDQILVNLASYFPYIKHGKEPKQLFEYQARMLSQMGQVNKETVSIITKGLAGADESLRELLEAAIMDALASEESTYLSAAVNGMFADGVVPPQLAPNQMQAFKSYYEQSADKLNLVNTVMLESTQAAYTSTVSDIVNKMSRTQSILNASAGEVITGVSSWNQATENAVRKMLMNGLSGFVDHAGRHWTPEAYVAMDIRTTMFNTARSAIWERADDFGSDLYQVSSHMGARPLCYPWQGKVVSRTDYVREVEDLDGNKITVIAQSDTSYGQAAGLFGINCRHYPMTFIPGISTLRGEPQDEEENLKTYQESQQQRGLERDLRYARRDLNVLKAQNAPPEVIKAQEQKVEEANERLDSFCDETGRHRRRSREATPIKASFPDPETYNVSDFPTEERDRIKEYFANKAKPTKTEPKDKAVYDFGGDKATIEKAAQEQIKGTLQMLQEQYPIPEGYSLDVSDFRSSRNLGYDEDLFDLLDRLEVEENYHYFGVGAQFTPFPNGKMRIEYIDTTNLNLVGAKKSFEEIHEIIQKHPGNLFNVAYGVEADTIHEYGHLLQYVYKFYGSQDPEFVAWFNSLDKEQIKRELSTYAATNWNEFFAESFLQSFSPYQSDLSKEAMKYLRKKMGK